MNREYYGYMYNGWDESTFIENDNMYLNIYKGIYTSQSTNSNKTYESVVSLVNIDLNERRIYKQEKRQHKIIHTDDGIHLASSNHELKPITILFNDLHFDDSFQHILFDKIYEVSNDNKIKVYNNNMTYNRFFTQF